MSHEEPYVKATLTFERADGETVTYEIPKAREVTVNAWAEVVDPEGPFGTQGVSRFVPQELNIGVTIKAEFDNNSGFTYRKLTTGKAAE